ncbi:MAG: nucleotide disphospho-sugar-binding domain-containing protein [Steroidobacteraceae bacterium]
MRKNHIAFFSFPHYPHLNPTLPIVSVLVRRGHRVTYVASEQYAARIAELGAEVVPCEALHLAAVFEEGVNDQDILEQPFCRLAARTLADVLRFYEANRPDLIIYDFVAFAGRILAHRWGIPAVQVSPQFVLDRTNFAHQITDPEFRAQLLKDSKDADAFLSRHGIVDGDFLFYREKLNIYFFPRTLQPRGTVSEETCFFAGRCAGEQPLYGDWLKENANGRLVALVSTSTSYIRGPDYFRMCMAALSGLGWHVVLSIGDQGDRSVLSPLPAHFEIVQHTSHLRILPHTTVFICLGGTITSAEAAYHGVPLLVTSHGFLEPECMGNNIARAGLGIHLKKDDTSVESIRDAAMRLSSDAELRDRVRRLQECVRREAGAEETANRIEEYLAACRSY